MRMGFEGPNEIVPTAPTGDSSNRVANTAFVATAIGAIIPNLTATSASLSGDVSLANNTAFFDGPSMAQGTIGTWFASGTVTVTDTSAASMICKLWDGTTVASSAVSQVVAGGRTTVSLSGVLTSPAGNIRISVQDGNNATGKIIFNASGLSKDSTISGVRIA